MHRFRAVDSTTWPERALHRRLVGTESGSVRRLRCNVKGDHHLDGEAALAVPRLCRDLLQSE